MKRTVKKAAVLGAGVMGSRIAAHLANAGVPTLLLDIVPRALDEKERIAGLTLESRQVRNRIAAQGLEAAIKAKPPAFYLPEQARLVEVGNFEDDLARLAEADWIIEAVVENLEVKRALLAKVDSGRRPASVVSTNTSGLSIRALAEGRSEDFRRHWLGTHFFNPPRYMRLLEIIPGPDTLPEVLDFIVDFSTSALGKAVVRAKDTPNFIANRIGIFGALNTVKVMMDAGYTIEEVDELTGPAIGHPKTATFRLADLAGIDTFVYVAENLYANAPHDEKHDLFQVPDFIKKMVERGWLGDKSGQGFYKRVKGKADGDILVLDYRTLEYRPRQKPSFPQLEMARNISDPGERLKSLIYSPDRAGRFIWKTTSELLLYAAARVPEIADDIVAIDNTMKLGFNWELGPFEAWDAIGVAESVERMEAEGKAIPPLVRALLDSGKKSFYQREAGRHLYFDLASRDYREKPERPDVIILASLKERKKVIRENAGASLIDLGDGIACLEFHSKMNAIGADTVEMMNYAVKKAEEEFEGLVIGNQAENFSVGANLMLLLLEAQEGNWDEIDLAVRSFQQANMALKYSRRPVVVAPFGMALGGGCEITMHGARAVAAAESYIGLVEVGAGLIPAGGGTKELLIRCLDQAPDDPNIDLIPYIKKAFETIAMAKVSTSAHEARELGFLRESDPVVMNRDHLLEQAKQQALALARAPYQPPLPRTDIKALGEPGLAALKLAIHIMGRAGYISEYDAEIGKKLARVLCGGELSRPTEVSEEYLLDLEREAFLSLCGQRKTQERMQYILKTGKPLRN